ncbi:MAG: transcriptional repressor [Clostridia bacterium]|mgnify:CR=1 FL=1|nr:transcriptional repressor [Clostridia bacterium]
MKNIEEYLKENGVKPSYQRIKIFEYLIKNKNHPKVETIFQELVQEIPTLSKTTVYNTLKLFLEKGIVQPILIEENEVRYDADITTHAHFKCEKCGEVYDFRVNLSQLKIEGLEEFQVKESHIYFKGICKKCL